MTTKHADPNSEEVEGYSGGPEEGSWVDYPIDTLLIRTEPRTVHEVLRRIDKGSFVMDPEFQRDFIWEEDKQSKLIESVLMRIPLPVFYLAEDDQGRMVVVDGLQRLSTLQRFVRNELKLKLPEAPELNKLRFQDLSPKLQNRVEDCNLILYIIDAKVPERARLDIFERVNGGVPLSRQQMRNCLFMGPATRLLKEEANSELFKKATGNSLRTDNMRDREFVNRFFAFFLISRDNYKGDMDGFLARALREMNAMPPSDLSKLSRIFRLALQNNLNVFDKHAFRRHTKASDSRSPVNASLWDVMSVGLSSYSEETVKRHARELRAAFYDLLEDEDFIRAITSSTNDVRKVLYRFETAELMFREVFGADSD